MATRALPKDFVSTAHHWFAVDELAPGVWRLAEPGHVCSWLVEGDDRAALIDTGCGIAPIRPVVESLSRPPRLGGNTHHHFDHVGGNHEWDEIAIHELGAPGLEEPVPRPLLRHYLDYARAMVASFDRYRALDGRFFHLLERQHDVRPLPTRVERGEWEIKPSRATQLLRDGDLVDLGGRDLRVWHTPGHSRDCISLELAAERLLFGGDTVNTGPVYAQLPDSDLAEFTASLQRLAGMAGHFDRVFCSHFMRTEVSPSFLRVQVEAFRGVRDGLEELRPAVDCVGTNVREAVFDGFSILVAAEED
jgi:glyoxylase-like metal-dependent hydrolase (beta-lactamase superfamily II)